MRKLFLYFCAAWVFLPVLAQQKASVRETVQTLKTYPFSDPDPVADPSDLFYPYFRFDGFSAKGIDQRWKTVDLENEYIKVTLFPEVGGKVWGAVDKTTGKEFIYNNHVVKFRDIAMRGPWVSGGIEFNFGIIGHAPTSSTPIDYLTKEKPDGSVSCYISSYEWVTRTVWTVEVNVPKDKAYFTTTTTWYNQSSVDQPYYQWMNAGYKATGNAQFCYPGNYYIGHGGEVFPFPKDEEGRDISWYGNNNFGGSKSEHVLGYYNDFYGVYWHEDDFGSVHHAGYDEKLGMKIFLWGQARDGAIWEELLTDTDGQYVELQSGRMYNQPASNSGMTPYKHYSFGPQMTDQWTEFWFPVKGNQGISKASRIGALNVRREGGNLNLSFSPLEALSTQLKIYNGDQLMKELPLRTKVLEPWKQTVTLREAAPEGQLRIVIGDQDLVYTEIKDEFELNRPMELPADFDWNSVYGLYSQGVQWMNQKVNEKAEHYLKSALSKEANFVPALNRLASLYYRQGRVGEALPLLNRALSIDIYDGEANYLSGLCNQTEGREADAKAGFSIASYSPAYRSAAYARLAEMSVRDTDWKKAEHYALKSLENNRMNLDARQLLMVAYRKSLQPEKAKEQIDYVLNELPLYHFARYENYLARISPETENQFKQLIRNELPDETYIEMAGWYERVGCLDEAMDLLSFAANNPEAGYRKAYMLHLRGQDGEAQEMIGRLDTAAADFVFPFRPESLKALNWASTVTSDWKPAYFSGLIYWANQDTGKALELLNACGTPGYAPFYLTRARLKQGKERLSDLLMAEQVQTSWRTGFALVSYYAENNLYQEAVEVGKKYMKMYPDNYYIGLKYAKALCETGQYASCISFIDKLQVLPNEGAYAGKAVYREANLYQAMDFMGKKNYSKALAHLNRSKEWPENLGVGKPYDNMIDSRLEDFIEARIQAGMGNDAKVVLLRKQVAGYEVSGHRFESGNLLTALALRDNGQVDIADRMVATWEQSYPDNKIAQWCSAVYKGDSDLSASLLNSRKGQVDSTPWESSYRDMNFDLMVRLFTK